MPSTVKRHLLTAALPYANGPVHIGHLAGVYIPADVYARYLRSKGEEVLFVCGSDEHGVPIMMRARKENATPQTVVDKYHQQIQSSFETFGISFDVYGRTTSPTHHQTASGFFKTLLEKNIFIEKTSDQFFDVKENQFLADRYIVGECPKCGFGNAYGDQCENCGSTLSPNELKHPKSMLSGEPPILKPTSHWYLPLDRYEDFLKNWILEGHTDWKTNVYGQCKSWIDQGLQPRAVTRDLEWGVPVPHPDAKGKVLYVWFDAPIGYISNTIDWAEKNNKNWKDYWQNSDTRLIHFIGKDNIVFHCIIFPIMLHTHGQYILPENVPANEFLNLEGNKISTSRNWAVWLHEYLEEFPEKQDVLRYTLIANAPETKDNDFTWKDFQTRNNSELVAILGNFINRTMVLTQKYFDNKVPNCADFFDLDRHLIAEIQQKPQQIAASLDQFKFREALNLLMDLVRAGNKYLTDNEPWKTYITQPERTATVLNLSLQVVANLAILSEPFLPFSSKKIREILSFVTGKWSDSGSAHLLPEGHELGKSQLLFDKIEDEVINHQIQKLEQTKAMNETPTKEVSTIQFDDFLKLELIVGTILEASTVEKSDKLLRFLVDIGTEKRTILSGIAKYYQPESLIGQQVSLIANLAPRKIMGVESKGMILLAEDENGKLSLMQPDRPVANGSKIS